MNILHISQTIQLLPPMQPLKRQTRHTHQPALPGMETSPAGMPQVTNRQIAEALAGIADMLAIQNGNPYRIQAYRNAARGVLELPEPAKIILERGEALPIPGLGERLRSHIHELIQHGSVTINGGIYLPTLPVGVRTLLTIKHIGPYTAIRLYEDLHIDSAEALHNAAEQHQIRALPGFGARSEARLKAAAERELTQNKNTSFQGVA